MNVTSRSWRTDLALLRNEAQIIDRGDHLVVRSDRRPHHVWKNFLLFSRPPSTGVTSRWLALYEREFPGRADAFSIAFGWDVADECTAFERALEDDGFRIEKDVEFTASSLTRPVAIDESLQVRPVLKLADWERIVARRSRLLCAGQFRDMQVAFEQEKFESYQQLVRQGSGQWYAAYLNDLAIGDMGLFVVDDRIGRFQEVWVYPGYQNAKLGRNMIYRCCEEARGQFELETYLAVTALGTAGASTYGSLGFNNTATRTVACRTVFDRSRSPRE